MIEFDKLDEFFKRKIILDGKYNGVYYDLHLHTKASDGFLDIKFLWYFLLILTNVPRMYPVYKLIIVMYSVYIEFLGLRRDSLPLRQVYNYVKSC